MKKFAVSYFSYFEGKSIVKIITAENKVMAMSLAIIEINDGDKHIKEWIQSINNRSEEEFKTEIFQGEILCDVIEIPKNIFTPDKSNEYSKCPQCGEKSLQGKMSGGTECSNCNFEEACL